MSEMREKIQNVKKKIETEQAKRRKEKKSLKDWTLNQKAYKNNTTKWSKGS